MRIGLVAFYLKHKWNMRLIKPPHGATSGCDPHTAYKELDENNFFGYIHDPGDIFSVDNSPAQDSDPQSGPLHRAFLRVFGLRKCPRQGESSASPFWYTLNDDQFINDMERDRTALRSTMTVIFRELLQSAAQNRVIFVCFCRAVPIMMQRLVEAAPGVRLDNVYMLALPYGDDTNTCLRGIPRDLPEQQRNDQLDESHRESFREYLGLFDVDQAATNAAANTIDEVAEFDAAANTIDEVAEFDAAASAAATNPTVQQQTGEAHASMAQDTATGGDVEVAGGDVEVAGAPESSTANGDAATAKHPSNLAQSFDIHSSFWTLGSHGCSDSASLGDGSSTLDAELAELIQPKSEPPKSEPPKSEPKSEPPHSADTAICPLGHRLSVAQPCTTNNTDTDTGTGTDQ
jgi:hypothetical protein